MKKDHGKGGPDMYDLLVKNGKVVDGTGFHRDVLTWQLQGGKSLRLGKSPVELLRLLMRQT